MKHLFLAALAALLLPLAAFAADDNSLVEVFATGVGTTQEAAMKAADRAAVEQVVGRMVDATTLVENDELVEDRILTYSAALIADSKIVGTPKSADGLITVKVKATVKKTALREKLVAAKILEVELDGESLWAQAISAQDNLADAEAMIKDVLAKHLACVVTEEIPGKNGKSTIDYDPKTGETFANVRVHVDMAKYRQFVKEVLDKLGPMAEKKDSVKATIARQRDNYDGKGEFAYKAPDGGSLEKGLVVMENPKTGSATVLWFDDNLWEAIVSGVDTGSIAVEAIVKDKTGDEISSRSAAVDKRDESGNTTAVSSLFSGGKNKYGSPYKTALVVPFFGAETPAFQTEISCWTAGTDDTVLRIPLGTFTADELKAAGKLQIRLGHLKNGQFVE